MPEGNYFQKVFEKNMCGPVKDMKVAFHSVPENTKGILDSDEMNYYSDSCVKIGKFDPEDIKLKFY